MFIATRLELDGRTKYRSTSISGEEKRLWQKATLAVDFDICNYRWDNLFCNLLSLLQGWC